MRQSKTLSERLWARARWDENGCILWDGHVGESGYGQLRANSDPEGPRLHPHQAAWILTHGFIPDGMWVIHKCRVQACFNPNHLFLGTPYDNLYHSIGVVGMLGEGNRRAKLRPDDVLLIRALHREGISRALLARSFGVTPTGIHYVIARKTWRHL